MISMLVGSMITVVGMLLLAPEDKPCITDRIEDCTMIDKAFDKAVKNCVEDMDWDDYDCFRYMNTGRAPATPTPRPSPTSMPKYKPYYDDSED